MYAERKSFAGVHNLFDGPKKDVNERLPIHDGEQLKGFDEHFTMFLSLITFDGPTFVVDDISSHPKMRLL